MQLFYKDDFVTLTVDEILEDTTWMQLKVGQDMVSW
jgi:hypothetical protein